MSETIFVLDNNGNINELKEASYISEELLQKLLGDYPALISGSQINAADPRRWLLISREFGVPDEKDAGNRWSLDHLFIDQDGIPTLVEVKRSTDTRIRREVVGQILDYAANAISYWTIEEIKSRFEASCNVIGKDPYIVLSEFLQEQTEPDTFWEQTRTNLKAGKIRMLIVADSIPKELQRIIEFLNEQLKYAEILGVEIKQFVGKENLKTLVPRVIGKTASADNVKGASKGKGVNWTKDEFFAELRANRGREEELVVEKLYYWLSKEVSRFWHGTGEKLGSLVPIFTHKGIEHQMFAVWTNGLIEIYFQWYKGKAPFNDQEKRLELLRRLNLIEGLTISADKISVRPSFRISLLVKESEYKKFVDAFSWYMEEVRKV